MLYPPGSPRRLTAPASFDARTFRALPCAPAKVRSASLPRPRVREVFPSGTRKDRTPAKRAISQDRRLSALLWKQLGNTCLQTSIGGLAVAQPQTGQAEVSAWPGLTTKSALLPAHAEQHARPLSSFHETIFGYRVVAGQKLFVTPDLFDQANRQRRLAGPWKTRYRHGHITESCRRTQVNPDSYRTSAGHSRPFLAAAPVGSA